VNGRLREVWLFPQGLLAHNGLMTDLLERAMATARRLPEDMQDEIARIVLMLAADEEAEPVVLTHDERSAIAESRAAAARGEFATDAEVRAVWAKHGL
jgi:hypothetical protein